MFTFEEFLQEAAGESGVVNLVFEERRYSLVQRLDAIATLLTRERIPYAAIGGMAVMAHVERKDNSAVRNTKDVDIMIQRSDLERVIEAATALGFEFRRLPIFAEEKTSPSQLFPNPPIRPEHLEFHGIEVAVVTVADLLFMKLTNFRDIDNSRSRRCRRSSAIAWTPFAAPYKARRRLPHRAPTSECAPPPPTSRTVIRPSIE